MFAHAQYKIGGFANRYYFANNEQVNFLYNYNECSTGYNYYNRLLRHYNKKKCRKIECLIMRVQGTVLIQWFSRNQVCLLGITC